tara:strand:- start:1133 stop:1558 length:426 start_codon:yes stop_codon:yes gene_type:complete
VIETNVSDELLESIKKNEGFRSRVYKDSLGFDTIGYGFAIKDLDLDENISEQILIQKLLKLVKNTHKKFPWLDEQPEVVKDVIYEMCYQLGVTGVSKFKKTLKYVEQNDYESASIEMLDSRWALQTPARANLLAEKMKSVV